jgi:Na+/melibiose symporter-like transporter
VTGRDDRLTFIQMLGSVLSSFVGIQKNATRERDFRHGRARDFILVGVLLTALFVLLLWGLVRIVVAVATAG